MTASTAVRGTESGAGETRSAEVECVRAAVLVADYQVDVVLPTSFTIETFIDDLVSVLVAAINDESIDFTATQGQWSLARPGEAPMPRWRCLADHDIADGAVLALTAVESSEVFTPVVEDITDALALINDREFAEFDSPTAALVGLIILFSSAVSVAVLLAWSWTRSGAILACALPALALGALSWCAAVIARRRFGSRSTAAGLVVTALPLLFAGTAMLVPTAYGQPGPFGPANFAAAAVITALTAVAASRSTGVATTLLTAVIATALVATIGLFVVAMTDLATTRVLGGVVLGGLILLTFAPRLAMALSRIRPPDLPDPGNEVSPATLEDLFEIETARRNRLHEDSSTDDTDDDPDRAAIDFETRARLAVLHLRGLTAATTLVLTIAALGSAAHSPGGIREILQAVAVSGVLAMRARWYPDRVQAIALLTGATVTVLGLTSVLVGTYESEYARTVIVLVFAATASIASIALARLPDRRLSPVTRRLIDLVEYAMILAVPVLACWIMGVYTAMRSI